MVGDRRFDKPERTRTEFQPLVSFRATAPALSLRLRERMVWLQKPVSLSATAVAMAMAGMS